MKWQGLAMLSVVATLAASSDAARSRDVAPP